MARESASLGSPVQTISPSVEGWHRPKRPGGGYQGLQSWPDDSGEWSRDPVVVASLQLPLDTEAATTEGHFEVSAELPDEDPLAYIPLWEESLPRDQFMELVKAAIDCAPKPERYGRAVRTLLELERGADARQVLAKGLNQYPGSRLLRRYDEVLQPPRFSRALASGVTKRDALDRQWLAKHAERYRGQWVVLLEGELVASGSSLSETWQRCEERLRGRRPLVTFIRGESSGAA